MILLDSIDMNEDMPIVIKKITWCECSYIHTWTWTWQWLNHSFIIVIVGCRGLIIARHCYVNHHIALLLRPCVVASEISTHHIIIIDRWHFNHWNHLVLQQWPSRSKPRWLLLMLLWRRIMIYRLYLSLLNVPTLAVYYKSRYTIHTYIPFTHYHMHHYHTYMYTRVMMIMVGAAEYLCMELWYSIMWTKRCSSWSW